MSQGGTTLEQKQAWMRERQSAEGRTTLPSSPSPGFASRHFTVAEISEMWKLSPDTVRRLFMKEPGVLVIGGDMTKRGARRYTTLRIPELVAERVHRRLCTVGGRTC